ncbi:MAG TPA: protein kinase [Acidimicrobiales bacterium]|nr:protein kinase [Acidimicrobiales bacterium]
MVSVGSGERIVAGWILERRLGAGGYGEVWQARRRHVDLVRALKLIPIVSEGAFESWRHEIGRLEALNHPNVVRFYDADIVSDGLYRDYAWIATELCERSLADGLRAREHHVLPWSEGERLLDAMLAALAAAHAAGMVHRDLKPANIVRHRNGTWKLCDFGTARLVPSDATHPVTQVIGTSPYMSPAAHRGQQNQAADLYALGVTVHEALRGERLHPRPEGMTDSEYIKAVLDDPPTISPDLPRRWQTVVAALIGQHGRFEAADLATWFTETRGESPPSTSTAAGAGAGATSRTVAAHGPAGAPGTVGAVAAAAAAAGMVGGATGPTVAAKLPQSSAPANRSAPRPAAKSGVEAAGPTPAPRAGAVRLPPPAVRPAPPSPPPAPAPSRAPARPSPPVAAPPRHPAPAGGSPRPAPPAGPAVPAAQPWEAVPPYATAPMGRRIVATLLDGFIVLVVSSVFYFGAVVDKYEPAKVPDGVSVSDACDSLDGAFSSCVTFGNKVYVSASGAVSYAPFAVVAGLLMFVLLQGLTGVTFGKLFTGLRVVGPDGRSPGLLRALLRTVFLAVDAFPYMVPLLGWLIAVSNAPHRRLGDLVASTLVVRRSMLPRR